MKKQLPIGINSFEKIISNNCVYIDKTQFVYELANHYGYYFLSRPRRFGKSLLLDTFKCLFEGKKELFEGLYIYDKWNWNKKFPVIKIDFASGDLSKTDKLIEKIFKILEDNYQYHDIPYQPTSNYNITFQTLVQKVNKKYQQRVVILIDEYDKPILDCITDIQTAIKHRDILRDLYSVIKGSDEILQFAFLTGVSKFSKM
ncbi:MAG: AAA family ATPase, partial [Candidatus Pacearchaeota archaeon]